MFQGSVGEPDPQLALHNALVTAKIIRVDFPQAWPDAMTSLISLLRATKDSQPAELAGALLILLRVVKELGTARLRKSQTALQSVTPELVHLLGAIYTQATAAWSGSLTSGQGNESEVRLAMSNSLTAFKALRRLLIYGYERPHKDPTVQETWSLSQAQFGQLLGYVSQQSSLPLTYQELVAKHLFQFSKLHVEMSETHAASFASLPSSFELVRAYWDLVVNFSRVFSESGGLRHGSKPVDAVAEFAASGPFLEKLALRGLLLLRSCIRIVNSPALSFKYRSPEDKEEQSLLIERVKADLLRDDMIIQVANVIISHLLIFRKTDLEAWEEDPEDWEAREETQGAAWEWEVRPCAENVLQHLLTHYKHLLIQPLLSYFATLKNPQVDIMTKESVYTTVGLAAAHIHDHFSFDDLLKSTIVVDAQQSGPLCKILRRRIGILLSQWVPINVREESRPLVYEIYGHFLNHDDENNDIVVRITAARQFKWVAEDFGFTGEVFQPFAEKFLTELIRLLGEVEVDETKLAIMGTARIVIERMETHVNRFAELIIQALPSVWESAGDMGFMMKQAVLTILQSLVVSMKEESRRYHGIFLPLVAEAVKEGTDAFLYLIEEALELWANVLLQSEPPLSPELLNLVGPALEQLGAQTENHMANLAIVGYYILLAPDAMLGDGCRLPLLRALSATYDSAKREQTTTATKHTETYIRSAEKLGGADGVRLIVQDMMESAFLGMILEGIHDAYSAHQTSGPNRRQPRFNNLILTDFFTILSRLAVAEPSILANLLSNLGPLDQVWQWFSSEWFASFDCMAEDGRRKLNMLALTRLMELGQPMQDLVLGKLQDYLTMWTSVASQIMDPENPTVDQLVLTAPPEGTQWDTPKDLQERALWASDPVRQINCLDFANERLGDLVQRAGGEAAFQQNYLVNVDAEVLNGFQALGTKGPGL